MGDCLGLKHSLLVYRCTLEARLTSTLSEMSAKWTARLESRRCAPKCLWVWACAGLYKCWPYFDLKITSLLAAFVLQGSTWAFSKPVHTKMCMLLGNVVILGKQGWLKELDWHWKLLFFDAHDGPWPALSLRAPLLEGKPFRLKAHSYLLKVLKRGPVVSNTLWPLVCLESPEVTGSSQTSLNSHQIILFLSLLTWAGFGYLT